MLAGVLIGALGLLLTWHFARKRDRREQEVHDRRMGRREDHDWKLVVGDNSVGEGDHMECRACGETREATEQEVSDSYNQAAWDAYER